MQQIDISAVPNQSISFRLESGYYDLTLKETRGCMSVTLVREGIILLQGERVVAGTPIIPYAYLQDGNFIITTLNGDMPDWNQFGITQQLIYASEAELEAL